MDLEDLVDNYRGLYERYREVAEAAQYRNQELEKQVAALLGPIPVKQTWDTCTYCLGSRRVAVSFDEYEEFQVWKGTKDAKTKT